MTSKIVFVNAKSIDDVEWKYHTNGDFYETFQGAVDSREVGEAVFMVRTEIKAVSEPLEHTPTLKLDNLIVDPPSGWMYGFPAPLQDDYRQQLIDAGYPEADLDFAMKHSRYWEDRGDE